MLFDTHTHLDSSNFNVDRKQVIARAVEQGVTYMINIGFNRDKILTTMALTEAYDFIYAAVGWHPVDAIRIKPEDIGWIVKLTEHKKVVAIGEIGLDYHWDTSPKEVQHRVFREQIGLARELNMPIIIHSRDAHEDVVHILLKEKACDVGGVMHSFSGSWEMAKVCLDMGFYISFGGPITFKNAGNLKKVLTQVPSDRLLIETDSPYLTPHPYRGKRNEPAHIRIVANTAAKLRGVEYEEFCKMTTQNAMTCFNIK